MKYNIENKDYMEEDYNIDFEKLYECDNVYMFSLSGHCGYETTMQQIKDFLNNNDVDILYCGIFYDNMSNGLPIWIKFKDFIGHKLSKHEYRELVIHGYTVAMFIKNNIADEYISNICDKLVKIYCENEISENKFKDFIVMDHFKEAFIFLINYNGNEPPDNLIIKRDIEPDTVYETKWYYENGKEYCDILKVSDILHREVRDITICFEQIPDPIYKIYKFKIITKDHKFSSYISDNIKYFINNNDVDILFLYKFEDKYNVKCSFNNGIIKDNRKNYDMLYYHLNGYSFEIVYKKGIDKNLFSKYDNYITDYSTFS